MSFRAYIETSVVSYLTAKPSRDLIAAAHQQSTRDFWEQLERFDVFVSELVRSECATGDTEAAQRRLLAVASIATLEYNSAVDDLARRLLKAAALPAKAADDAIHVALAAVHGMDFLATWNCKHIANPSTRHKIEQTCREAGYTPPILCTPEELLEVDS
jgi:predicted nucleic acid-binding protein